MTRLFEKYKSTVAPALREEFDIKNLHAIPRLEKIVVSMGFGKAVAEKSEKRVEEAVGELAMITGQKAQICKSRKSVSNFKLRDGMDIGAKVTMRRVRMYEFFDRLVSVAIPRVRDFRGLSCKGFDGRGNYNMGLTEQLVFPEVNPDKVQFVQGMNIAIVTTAGNDERGRSLLRALGFPLQVE